MAACRGFYFPPFSGSVLPRSVVSRNSIAREPEKPTIMGRCAPSCSPPRRLFPPLFIVQSKNPSLQKSWDLIDPFPQHSSPIKLYRIERNKENKKGSGSFGQAAADVKHSFSCKKSGKFSCDYRLFEITNKH